jgi:uncharacterized Ntn-hydrolase superfamily protein
VTYSIVARDPRTGALGVAVQSHWFSVGSVVPAAEAGVGAVATQAFVEASYGPLGVARMRAGAGAREALDELLAADEARELRQVAMVDAGGGVAAHTGAACVAGAGHVVGDGVSARGNMLDSDAVWQALLPAFEAAAGPLAERLLAALEAAEAAGGDIRGRQSAAILVVGGERSDRPWEGVRVDLRVEDDPDPLPELRRLLAVHRAYEKLGEVLELRDGPTDALERALADLAEVADVLGDNPEPTVWRAVFLARAGRLEEARRAVERAAALNPRVPEFLRRLDRPGFLDRALAELLLGDPAPPRK